MAESTFSDFSGGITDFKFNVASNYAEIMDNFLVLRDKSMECRPGNKFYDIQATRVIGNERISKIIDLDGSDIFFTNANIQYIDGGFVELLGPTGNPIFNNGDAASMVDAARFGDQYICVDDDYSNPMKLFKDENGNIRAINAGLPIVISDPTLTESAAGDKLYNYAFVYSLEYRVGNTLFIDKGEPRYLTIEDIGTIGGGTTVNITDYIELTNGATRNYDTVNLKKEIYRTIESGTTYYKVGEIDNNVTSFVDNFDDITIQSNEVLYTQGGIKPNELPPPCKYIASNNNIVYYANIVESAEVKPYRLRFSKESDPDSVPETFFEDFEADITGIAAIEDKTVVFTEGKAVALEGILDDLGRGTIIRRTIADVGCVSNSSIVTTKDFIYWFAPDGIYKTNGVTYEKLTNHLDQTYQGLTDSEFKTRKITSTYDKVNQRVFWCINRGSADNDSMIIFDEVNPGFVTWSSGVDMSPTALAVKGQSLLRADADGYVFEHDDSIFSDLVKDETKPVGNWNTKAIPYEWKHVTWTMGDARRVKWVPRINFVGRPGTNVYLEPRIFREGSLNYYSIDPITFNPLMIWGDPSIVWGNTANRWNSVDYLNQSKRNNSKTLRVTHLQLSLASAYVVIQKSVEDTGSYITVDATAKTASVVNPAIYSFVDAYEGYDMIIDGKSYEILTVGVDTVVLKDDSNELVDGTYTYEIKGYPKAQRPQISDITLMFEYFGGMDKLQESA